MLLISAGIETFAPFLPLRAILRLLRVLGYLGAPAVPDQPGFVLLITAEARRTQRFPWKTLIDIDDNRID